MAFFQFPVPELQHCSFLLTLENQLSTQLFLVFFWFFFLLILTLHNHVHGGQGFSCVLGWSFPEQTVTVRAMMQLIYPCVSDHRVTNGLKELGPNART